LLYFVPIWVYDCFTVTRNFVSCLCAFSCRFNNTGKIFACFAFGRNGISNDKLGPRIEAGNRVVLCVIMSTIHSLHLLV
jgi:hypothetical protein